MLGVGVPSAVAHTKTFESSVTLGGYIEVSGETAWYGNLTSPKARCVENRRVEVYRSLAGPGDVPDTLELIGFDRAAASGDFTVTDEGFPPPDGDYFAKVRRKDIGRGAHNHRCGKDTSNVIPVVTDPNDQDSDGWENQNDNCPELANADQTDTDNDLKGDACDPCPLFFNPGTQECPAEKAAGRKR
jgi:hypothetical protein